MGNKTGERSAGEKLKKVFLFLSIAIALGFVIFLLRGQYISDTLKGIILPELETASGQKVTAQKISINLFPLFIEARGIRVFDQDGNNILTAQKVKGYIGLSGLLYRQISIDRLAIHEPGISANRQRLEEIIRNVRAYLEKERKAVLEVKVKVIEVRKGVVSVKDDTLGGAADMKGLSGELILGDYQRFIASVKELVLEKEGWPKIVCDINASVVLKSDRVEIKRLEIGSYGSRFRGEGFYSRGRGILRTEIALLVDSIKRIFRLGQKGDGKISAKGEVRIQREEDVRPSIRKDRSGPASELHAERPPAWDLKHIFFELKLSGDFYLQALMEFLKVKEKLEGFLDFQGEITGPLSDISGKATARLRNGKLFGVDIDSLTCNILYRNGLMKFENGNAQLYHGTAEADASIPLPVVDSFTLNVTSHSIDSGAALKLIGWEPEIPAGKVDGELSTSGTTFNPDGWFAYRSLVAERRSRTAEFQPPVDNVLNRIKEIKGYYSLKGGILSLSNLKINTPSTNMTLTGTVDIKNKSLDLKSRLSTENVSDLTIPYYRGAGGHGEFSGGIVGPFDDPGISGRANFSGVSIEDYRTDSIIADFAYRKRLLDIREALFRSSGETHSVKGKISFPEAKELFDLVKPVYNLRASIRKAEFGNFVRIFSKDFSAAGILDADFTIGGKDENIDISGKATVERGSVYQIPFDSATASVSYAGKELSLKKVKVTRGKSVLTAEGRITPEKRFSYNASSDRIFLRDTGLERVPDDTVLSVHSEGNGSFDDPFIVIDAKVEGGTFKGRNLGGGKIHATIRNREIAAEGSLFNEKMRLKGRGYLDGELPWDADISILPGRYDFIVSPFLKDVPEDLQLNVEGRIGMKGDRKHISASVSIDHLSLSLFGESFTNDSQILFSVDDRKLSLTAFHIKSGLTSFRLQGGLEIGKEYDIQLAGNSSLAPLKGLSKKIGYLKGDADFAVQIRGKWENPEMNGGVDISNASFGLRDYPSYISSLNGHLDIDGDKIIMQKLSGKIGGGDVNISGIVYLKAFSLKRFYLEARLNEITAPFSKDFSINFDGNLVYKGTMEAMSITGDIKINRAKYKQMVEWRTWILTPKAVVKPRAELSVFERAELNIRVSGSENISIDNNIARAPLRIRGDMIIKGSISSPILFGRIEATEGYAYFRNNEFRIIYASVDFADPNRIKPVINLVAETTVQGYDIRLNLEGQMERFNLSLSSDPHLEEGDILSLLTVGQVGKQLKGLEGGIGAGEATAFITGKVQDVIEERLRSITGLDRFQVEPYVSKTTGTIGPRVTVSERLIGDKLYVTYATSVGSTEEQIIKIEYLLTKSLSLIGVRDERGSLGGDVKFRFEFR